MIQALAIENFQSHKRSSLEFAPGINALIGNSDCGKSAVLRALCWAVLNSPSGDAYISDWAKTAKGAIKADRECSVIVYGDGKTQVQRLRSATFNGYVVKGPDGNVTEFEALRTDVPQQVKDALNIGEVNIQRQMDGPFLLSMTAGEVARYVNTLVDLTKIDEYQSAVNAILRNTGGLVKATQDEVDRAQARVDSLSWVPEAEKIIDDVIELEKKASAMTAELKSLADQITSHAVHSEAVKETTAALDVVLPSLERMKQCWDEERAKESEISRLKESLRGHSECMAVVGAFPNSIYEELLKITGLMTEIAEKRAKIQDLNTALLRHAEVSGVSQNYPDGLDESIQRISRLYKIIHNSDETIGTMKTDIDRHEKLVLEAAEATAELQEIGKTLSTMVCPLCGHVGCESIH